MREASDTHVNLRVRRYKLTITRRVVAQIVTGTRLVSAELVHCLGERAAWLAELDHTRLQVAQRAFDEAVLLLVMRQQVMPKRMLWST